MDLLVSTIAGAAAGLLAAITRSYFETRAKVDDQLHHSRTVLYQELWRRTALLPKWPRRSDVTYGNLSTLSEWLRSWYFGTTGDAADRVPGGLYLSRPARDEYGRVQEALASAVGQPEGIISERDYDHVREALSQLRTQMTADLLSRRGAPFRLT